MNNRVLLVDDDINLLNSVRRQLKGKYDLTTASSGREGVEYITKEKEYAVIISDYKMPKMNGLEFLMKVREISKGSIRMMLTGQADIEAIIQVINEGSIFRFLTKPCPPELFTSNLDAGLEQYRLINAEKELISKTLSGSLQVMMDLMMLAKPEAFNQGVRVKKIVNKMIKYLNVKNPWQIEIAVILAKIGCITVPDAILSKLFKNMTLTNEEKSLYHQHVSTSSDLISKIPRLENVAEIILYQEKYYNGEGPPSDPVKGDDIPLGSRLIRLVNDYDQIIQLDSSSEDAMEVLKKRGSMYDQTLIPLLEKSIKSDGPRKKYIVKELYVSDLKENMYLAGDITTASGVILGSDKQRITKPLLATLVNYAKNKEIREPIPVLDYVE